MYQILLSPFHKLFYYEWKLDPARSDYNIVFNQSLYGNLQIDRLTTSLQRLVKDHLLLNSHIKSEKEKLYWLSNEQVFKFDYFEDNLSNTEILSYVQKPFNLEHGPLYRFGLSKIDDYSYILIIVLHHIIIDGLSFNDFCKELANYYNYPLYKNPLSLTQQIFNISKLSNKLSEYIENHKEKSKVFWQDSLINCEILELDFLKYLPQKEQQKKTKNIKEIRFFFEQDIVLKLDKLKNKYNLTPYLFGQIIYAILLYKCVGQNKFAISYPVSIKEGKDLIYAASINTNFLPYNFEKVETIGDLFKQTKDFIQSLKANEINHSYLPTYDIIRGLNKGLLNIMFIQTNLKDSPFELEDLEIVINEGTNIDLQVDLLFEHEVKDNKVNYRVRYKSEIIHEGLLNNFIGYYKKLFIEILNDLVILEKSAELVKIQDYALLTQKQYQQIIGDWNATDKNYPSDKLLHQLFEEQVRKTQDNIAVVYEETRLTYQQLNEKSNQLANYLKKNFNIQPDSVVALCLDRSEHMLIAILAVLKAGGAYVPMDPNYPDERIAYILQDTASPVVLVNEIYKQRLEGISAATEVAIDSNLLQEQLSKLPSQNLQTKVQSNNLAYVLYTSGTTGNPKGVMIEHQAEINGIYWTNALYPLKSTDKTLQKSPYVFDASVWELLWTSLYGATVVFAKPDGHKDPNYLSELIEKESISIIHFVPSMLTAFTETIKISGKTLPSLKCIFCAGEALNLLQVKNCQQLLPHSLIYNIYGPTEAGYVSYYDCSNTNIEQVSIGKPIYNVTVYILDHNLTPLPIGVIGELYVGGVELARGYLNRDDLTAEKFITNPFITEEEKRLNKNLRLYKTGDLVRWLPDGNIEYIGRNDFQVKIRGYRIELGEIENAIASYEEVRQSVVLMQEYKVSSEDTTSNKYLVAYYVADHKLDEPAIINHLSAKLPEYMVPSVLVYLQELPLTINGKLDRDALPNPEFNVSNDYVAPRNNLERQICQIWAKLLALPTDKVGIQHDFFKLGGNSILAIRLVNKVNSELKSNIKVSDIFSLKTIKTISELTKKSEGQFIYQDYLIETSYENHLFEPYPLNNVQQAYFLGRINSFELGSVATHFYSEYKYSYLNLEKLEKAFNILLARHLALRTIFIDNNEQCYLKDYPHYEINLHICHTEHDLLNIRNRLSHKIYDPQCYPLFDIEVSKFQDRYILHLSLDALIMDGRSLQILFSEWSILYNDPNYKLSDISVTHRNYILQYEKVRESKLFTSAQEYWQKKVDEYDFNFKLPLVINPADVKKAKFNRVTKTIPNKIWQKIIDKALFQNISLTALLLEIYGYVLSYWTNQENLCINLTLFNRLPLHSDINEVVGDFTVLELFNYQDKQNATIIQRIKKTHNNLLQDIESNLFDGIDFQRLLRKAKSIPMNQTIAPVILTSILGNNKKGLDLAIDKSYQGVEYSITQTSQVWLDNKAYETEGGFVAEWDYVEQLFDKNLITYMHEHYCYLIEWLSKADWQQEYLPKLLLPHSSSEIIEYANNAKQLVRERTLFSSYESFINQHNLANNTAIIDVVTNLEYSYRKLIEDTSLLAKYLYQNKTNSQLIGILSEKGYNQAISTLAIMKSGHGYLPLNVEWPIGRLDEVLEQGKVRVLLISKKQYLQLENLKTKYNLIVIEDILSEISNNPEINLVILPQVKPDDIAYVIFTSGSTGKPKGVTISHRAALNTIDAINARFRVTSQDKILALSELSFDLSVYDLFGILAVGGQIIYPNQEEVKNPKHWLEIIDKYEVTIWDSVPQLAGLLTDEVSNKKSMRLFLLSGDWLPMHLPNKLKHRYPAAVIMSLGGATEASIWSIWYEIKEIQDNWRSIPYGTAMPNQKMYILNYRDEDCPVGVVGEIHIGGMGLALNYWQDDKLTAAKFTEHPSLGRLYRTGDLGKWHPEGYIEFIGRKDFQVKIRGYRVELGEIASKIMKLPGVAEAIVIVQKSENSNYLVGYLLHQQKNKNTSLSKEQQELFKLKQYGIIKGSIVAYQFTPKLDCALYKLRKSYRNFLEQEINVEEVRSLTQEIYAITLNSFSAINVPSTTKLIESTIIDVLSAISAITFRDRALPKYRYPSGGSTYSVRCFIVTPDNIDKIGKGYYYYNPVNYSLSKLMKEWPEVNSTHYELHLVIHWPAIKPLYGDIAKKLAYLEVGHMVSLLTRGLYNNNINFRIKVEEQELDNENLLAVRLIIGDTQSALSGSIQPNYLIFKENQYLNENQEVVLDFTKQTIFSQSSEQINLLKNGKMVIFLSGEESTSNLVKAGALLQNISERLYIENIGSTMLGSLPEQNVLYAMVIGKVSVEEKNQLESKGQELLLTEIVNSHLSKILPSYMIPDDYIVLDKLPLSSNGKLDINKLPQKEIITQNKYVAPINEIEKHLCQIWSEVLKVNSNIIGINNNFFSLGGNSLLAMQVVSSINSRLKLNIKLSDFYKNASIHHIATNFYIDENDNQEEGII